MFAAYSFLTLLRCGHDTRRRRRLSRNSRFGRGALTAKSPSRMNQTIIPSVRTG